MHAHMLPTLFGTPALRSYAIYYRIRSTSSPSLILDVSLPLPPLPPLAGPFDVHASDPCADCNIGHVDALSGTGGATLHAWEEGLEIKNPTSGHAAYRDQWWAQDKGRESVGKVSDHKTRRTSHTRHSGRAAARRRGDVVLFGGGASTQRRSGGGGWASSSTVKARVRII